MLDLSSAADLGSIQTQARANFLEVDGVSEATLAAAYDVVIGNTLTAIAAVNTEVSNLTDTDLTSSATKGLFQAADFLASQVLTASQTSTAGAITLTDSTAVTTLATSAASNSAPSDLLISSSSFDENSAASLTFTGVDDSSTAFTFACLVRTHLVLLLIVQQVCSL